MVSAEGIFASTFSSTTKCGVCHVNVKYVDIMKLCARRVVTELGFAIAITFVGASCCASDVNQVVAQCESDAYGQIGVESDRSASLEYQEKKHELVRVCLVRQGFKFKSDRWSAFYLQLSENIHRSRGTWNRPGSDPATMASNAKVRRQVHIAQMSSAWWQ